MRVLVAALLSFAILVPLPAAAADQAELLKRIEELSKELNELKQQVQELKEQEKEKEERLSDVEWDMDEITTKAEEPPAVEIGGDYRFRYDYLDGTVANHYNAQDVLYFFFGGGPPPQLQKGEDVTNDALMINRFGLNLKARATENIQVKARLLMYKVWGHSTAGPLTGSNGFFADRSSVFDGNVSHVPEDSILRVDQAYATWSNILDLPIWFSVGRRPSTGGIPTNLRQNEEKIGTAGTPGLMVDYAFDGLTFGVMPQLDFLPGAYTKFCYGKGFDSGFRPANNGVTDVAMYGVNVVPYSTDTLHLEFQWNRGANMFAFPETTEGNTNLGDIDQYGGIVMSEIPDVGPGTLNLFASAAISSTHPNSNLVSVPSTPAGVTPAGPMVPVAGLLYDAPAFGGEKKDKTGYAVYAGFRYDFAPTWTKLGFEYNHGSKNWITFLPASDDLFTAKLGTRGDVYEVYLIQQLNQKPIAKRGLAYLRLGYQNYRFRWTGSNNWVGAPQKIYDLDDPGKPQMLKPLERAQDLYLTFDVVF